ncbi:hypothetical protein ACJMK2_000456 [Sinanodonta woodiana]|uniref:Thiaminase-2/PQQC domain-containing protein n=1 Tax=Sinanodonta woodiana TaxID=1069815 RepID=A0ABD3XPE9_SINWO
MSAPISPRHADRLVDKLSESVLFRDLADRASQHRLKAGDELLSEFLWKSTQSQQQDALNSKFIQGLRYGNLDPTRFGGYMVQDSIYCYYCKGDIDIAATKATDPNLREFLEQRSKSYITYYEEMFKKWHIIDASGIELNKECKDYADLEKNVAETMDPLYLVVALIPCHKLWPWLGQQITWPQHDFGVYESWVTSNLNPCSQSYRKLDKIIDDAFLVGAIDKEQALCVYRGCMIGEATFFSSV